MRAPKQVFESNDVSVELGYVRVVDGERNVVYEEVDDVVVPFQNLEYGFAAISNLEKR